MTEVRIAPETLTATTIVGEDPLVDQDDATYASVTGQNTKVDASYAPQPDLVGPLSLALRIRMTSTVAGADNRFNLVMFDATTFGSDYFARWQFGRPLEGTIYDITDFSTTYQESADGLTWQEYTGNTMADPVGEVLPFLVDGNLIVQLQRTNDSIWSRPTAGKVLDVFELAFIGDIPEPEITYVPDPVRRIFCR